MANRRMFSLKIIDTDHFLDLPATAQVLYFHLALRADDDGFVAAPKRVMRMIGSGDDDFKLLVAKEYIIPFETGVCVIKHWRVHNYIQSDRYHQTFHRWEQSLLMTAKDNAYMLNDTGVDMRCIQDVTQNESKKNPQVRLGKVRLGKSKETLVPKIEYADHVKMTEVEYDRLVERYGEEAAKGMIIVLDLYKGSVGKTYKSDYLAILSWVHKRYFDDHPNKRRREVTD